MSGIAVHVLETSIIEHVMGSKCYGKKKTEQSQSGEKITVLRRVVVTEKVTFEQHPSR